jgi:hypothetical protein
MKGQPTRANLQKKKANAKKRASTTSGIQVRKAPVSKGVSINFNKPKVQMLPNGNVLIKHREYLKDITGSTEDFSLQESIPIQPGLQTSFPWLSSIANKYESYVFRKLSLRYLTMSPTSETGYLAFIPDYDPKDSAPDSKTKAMQNQNAMRVCPWDNKTLAFGRENLHKRKTYFTRFSSESELGLHDIGNLFVIVGGNQTENSLGELWWEYEIELMTPQEPDGLLCPSLLFNATGTISDTSPFGDGSGTFSFGSFTFLEKTSGTILTFTSDCEGLAIVNIVGTTISSCSLTCSAYVTGYSAILTATASTDRISFKAVKGDTLTLSTTSASLSSCILQVASYATSLA